MDVAADHQRSGSASQQALELPALRRDHLTVRLAGQRGVADVVIAGHRMPPDGKVVEENPGPAELAGLVRAVEGQVAAVDHEVGPGAVDVIDHGVPVGNGLGARGDRWVSDTTVTQRRPTGGTLATHGSRQALARCVMRS